MVKSKSESEKSSFRVTTHPIHRQLVSLLYLFVFLCIPFEPITNTKVGIRRNRHFTLLVLKSYFLCAVKALLIWFWYLIRTNYQVMLSNYRWTARCRCRVPAPVPAVPALVPAVPGGLSVFRVRLWLLRRGVSSDCLALSWCQSASHFCWASQFRKVGLVDCCHFHGPSPRCNRQIVKSENVSERFRTFQPEHSPDPAVTTWRLLPSLRGLCLNTWLEKNVFLSCCCHLLLKQNPCGNGMRIRAPLPPVSSNQGSYNPTVAALFPCHSTKYSRNYFCVRLKIKNFYNVNYLSFNSFIINLLHYMNTNGFQY